MKIERLILGPLQTNTYLLSIDDNALLIDPASKPEKLIDIIGDKKLLGILLTHGHFDHIKAVDGLYDRFKCPVYLNKLDEEMARDKNSGEMFGLVSYISCPLIDLNEGKMHIGPFEFEVIYSPGHTKGSSLFVFDDGIFTGDTLFKCSVGRTDLPGGDNRQLKDSLRIFNSFNKDYYIYPGHDDPSTLSFELLNNPFLNN